MSAYNYEELLRHLGHNVVVVAYGSLEKDWKNVAIECEDCCEVLLDYDKEEDETNSTNST